MELAEIRNKCGFICDMDTDIVAGIHAEITTLLVLSGVTAPEDIKSFAYHPHHVLDGVGDIPD